MDHPTKEQVDALAEAMWQVLDDMGVRGTSCCLVAKAQARIAFEPWREEDFFDWMTLEEAERIVREAEMTR